MAEKHYSSYRCEKPGGAYVFLYPTEWRTREIAEDGRREVFITGPSNRAGTYSISLAVAVTRSATSSPVEAAAELLARYRAAFDSKGTGPSATTVAGLTAVEVEVVYSMPLPLDSIHPQWTAIRQRSIFFKQGEQLIELDYAASEEDYQTWLPAFRALTRSFTFEAELARPVLRRPVAVPAFPQVREDAAEYEVDGSQSDEQSEQHVS